MPKIYTKTGDKGQTGLIGGQRIWKDSLRIEAYGTVDELNSILGIVLGFVPSEKTSKKIKIELDSIIKKIQNELFDLGCQLATLDHNPKRELPQISASKVTDLEKLIDRLEEELPPLRQFILPGGHPLSGFLHFARSVCRRAERRCVELFKKESVEPTVIHYLNRLSDALFVLARWTQKNLRGKETLWNSKKL